MARFATVFTNTIIASPAAGAETVIATTGGINPATDTAPIILLWFVELTIGTSGVSCKALLRRGSATSGTLINVGQATTVVAANLYRFSGVYQDTPGAVGELQYSLSLLIGSGAAPSTVSDVALLAMCL